MAGRERDGNRSRLQFSCILSILYEIRNLSMDNTRVSASEFQQSFGSLSDKARQEPVVITKHGRDSLVIMSADEWERLKRRDRRVGLTQDMSDEWIDAIRDAKAPDRLT
jgi:prevent-host-death family protein